jgi:hypothetical protein
MSQSDYLNHLEKIQDEVNRLRQLYISSIPPSGTLPASSPFPSPSHSSRNSTTQVPPLSHPENPKSRVEHTPSFLSSSSSSMREDPKRPIRYSRGSEPKHEETDEGSNTSGREEEDEEDEEEEEEEEEEEQPKPKKRSERKYQPRKAKPSKPKGNSRSLRVHKAKYTKDDLVSENEWVTNANGSRAGVCYLKDEAGIRTGKTKWLIFGRAPNEEQNANPSSTRPKAKSKQQVHSLSQSSSTPAHSPPNPKHVVPAVEYPDMHPSQPKDIRSEFNETAVNKHELQAFRSMYAYS